METAPRPPRTVSDIAGDRIRTARERRGWTLQQLADAAAELGGRLSRHAIHDIERGRPGKGAERQRQITLDEWLILAEALAVPPLWLIVPLDGRDQLATAPASARGPASAIPWITADNPGQLDDEQLQSWRKAKAELAVVSGYVSQLQAISSLLAAGPSYSADISEAVARARQLADVMAAQGFDPPPAPEQVTAAIMSG